MNLKKNKVEFILLSVLIIFFFHQSLNIFIGGNTYDELFLIYESGNIYNKVILFFTDNSNPKLLEIGVNEYYGFLVILPIYILSNSSKVNSFLNNFYSFFDGLYGTNPDEIIYQNMHIFLTVYVVIMLYFIFRKLKFFYQAEVSLLIIVFLIFYPSFSGQSMFNIKDLPYALQLFLATIYLAEFNSKLVNENEINKLDVLLVGLNVGLACLIRINAYPFIGLVSVFYLYKTNKNIIKNFLIKNTSVFLVSIIFLFLGTPSSWKSPLTWARDALIHQLTYSWSGYTLTNGQFIEASNIDSTYLVQWLFFRTPINYIVGVLVLSLFFITRRTSNEFTNYSFYFFVVVNILFILFRPSAYDGIRQFLFLLPFVVVMFVNSIFLISKKKKTLVTLFIVSLFYVCYSQYGLGPYKYIYLNEFVNTQSIDRYCEKIDGCGDWPTDYYAYSGKELAIKIDSLDVDIVLICKPPQAVTSYIKSDTKVYRSIQEIKNENINTFFVTTFQRPRPFNDSCRFDINEVDYNCYLVDSQSTKLRGQSINLSYLSKCSVNY
tara:strand:+ start:3160 stop:4800 length:1641 start_codon:yes stop_codon:yes gene_type:complete